MEKGPLTNWAGNLTYATQQLYQPSTVPELQELIRKSKKMRALGSRHSFNSIADSDSALVSTSAFNRILSLDKKNNTVTVEAGIRYGELCGYFHENGYALHNLASLPHISVAGACATATHGSGIKNGNLGIAVTAIEFINGRGDLVKLSREKDGDQFCGTVVNLGALGVVTKITLAIQPAFTMKQAVFQDMPVPGTGEEF